ncbi:hypothetical protein [Anderseniella sp. Alg231-50]|uniref:hypothetical protein n=1 Tax=Anderseniella sp. Alg231-50 TaxID=1922226 RepID=UPI00307CA276
MADLKTCLPDDARVAELMRTPQEVMRLARMGASHQTRLSFMRAILRRVKREGWQVERTTWDVDENGVGVGVYEARGPEHTYSLIAYANDLPPEKRSDRVIATEWDATFALFDGVPTGADIDRLRDNVPKQEAGRCAATELVLSRANRSVRLFDHVADCLAQGRQPDVAEIDKVGYLMRTTAVYGNGKFGLADRDLYARREEAGGPFRVELLAVWLIRVFTVDIVEHMARIKGGAKAVLLDHDIRRRLGVGNSTGLGMAPFLVTHPALLNAWITARETALARVRALPSANAGTIGHFLEQLDRAHAGLERWHTPDERQSMRVCELAGDFGKLKQHLATGALTMSEPWNELYLWAAANLTLEGQEAVCSLVIEPHGDLVDDLAGAMAADERRAFAIDGTMRVDALAGLAARHFDWALATDFDAADQTARFWYVSEEKLEPRLGERHEEDGVELEQRLGIGREVATMMTALENEPGNTLLAEFLLRKPEHRHAARRVQLAAQLPYAEIHDNVLSATMMPIDMLRCKLAFFGASRFDPKSDRWVRITMYADAPFPDEIEGMDADDWAWPLFDETRPA